MCKKAYLKKTHHAHNKSWWKSLHHVSLQNYRSSCLQMFLKIGVLINFAIFTGKHL